VTKREAQEHARKESRRVVEQLKRENAKKPAADLVPASAYDRLQKLLEQKIASYATQ
jgi:hypothetical protein